MPRAPSLGEPALTALPARSGPWQDFRLALRAIRRAPGAAAMVVAVLALGIGGTTAVYSVLSGILLRPLLYPDADRLAVAWEFNAAQGLRDGVSPLNAADWAARSTTIEASALFVRPEFTAATIRIGGVKPGTRRPSESRTVA